MKVMDLVKLMPASTELTVVSESKVHVCYLHLDPFACDHSTTSEEGFDICGDCGYLTEEDSEYCHFKGINRDTPIRICDMKVSRIKSELVAGRRKNDRSPLIKLVVDTKNEEETA